MTCGVLESMQTKQIIISNQATETSTGILNIHFISMHKTLTMIIYAMHACTFMHIYTDIRSMFKCLWLQ